MHEYLYMHVYEDSVWETYVRLCMCVCMEGYISGHGERVGHCGLACSAQEPLPAFEGESDSRLLAGMPCGIYFCLSAH